MSEFKNDFIEEIKGGFNEPHTTSVWFDAALYLAGFAILVINVSWSAAVGVLLCLWAQNLSQLRKQHEDMQNLRREIKFQTKATG